MKSKAIAMSKKEKLVFDANTKLLSKFDSPDVLHFVAKSVNTSLVW